MHRSWVVYLPSMCIWSSVFLGCRGAFTDQFMQQVEDLVHQRELRRLDEVWHDVSTLYGLLRPPSDSRINIYRAATDAHWTFPPLLQLEGGPMTFPINLVNEIAALFHDMYAYRLVPIDPARGQSTNRDLWLPTYCVLCLDTVGSHGHRPQGLVELRMDEHLLCFPTILPRYINKHILSRFLHALVPMHHPDLSGWGYLNGGLVGIGLRQVFNGFFVQYTVSGRREVLRDLVIAAPTIMLQLHLDRADFRFSDVAPGLEQVLAFVPGGLSLSLSREAAFLCRQRGLHRHAEEWLRQRFADLQAAPFQVKDVYPAIRWMEPVNTQTSYIVALLDLLGPDYTTVVVQLWLYPLVLRGAVSCPRMLTKRDLISQLRLETTCGGEGDWCICYVNTYPLETEGRHINPGDYIACWAAERDQEDEVLSIEDSEDWVETAANPTALRMGAYVSDSAQATSFGTGASQPTVGSSTSQCGHLPS